MHFWKCFFRASQQHHFHKHKTLHTKYRLLLILAIPPRRFWNFANQLGGLTEIRNSKHFAQRVLHFLKIVFGRRSKNSIFENALPSRRNACFFVLLQYCSYFLSDSYVPSLSPRALPTSTLAILTKRYCNNRDSAVSSSRRFPTSFGGLLAFLWAPSRLPRILLRRPEKAPRIVWGLLVGLPTI